MAATFGAALARQAAQAASDVYGAAWFVALVCVLLVLAIIAACTAVYAFRRLGIAAKKIDYLAEDLAYKAEKAAPALDALARLAGYAEIVDALVRADAARSGAGMPRAGGALARFAARVSGLLEAGREDFAKPAGAQASADSRPDPGSK